VPWGLKRFQESRHFVTFYCYHRRPWFTTNTSRQTFETALERVRGCFGLWVYGYVVMPEHVHLLIGEPQRRTLADALKRAKARCVLAIDRRGGALLAKTLLRLQYPKSAAVHGKLRYIHRNPVKRRLCERPDDWEWSSFRHYATGIEGRVEIESEWAARKRERAAGRLCLPVDLPHSSQNKA
jgi:putative transposase